MIYFLIKDIKRNWFSLLWNTIQLTVVALIAVYLLQAFLDYRQIEQKISQMTEQTEIYMFRNQTEGTALDELINDEKKCKQMADCYDAFQKKLQENTSNIKTFTADDSLGFPMHREQRGQIRRALGLPKEQEELARIQVSENFFDIYGIQWEGDKKAFVSGKTETIPIVAGADLKKLYHLHDVLYDQGTQKYEIIGFMDKDSFYVAPGKTREKIRLDQAIIQLNRVDKEDIFSLWGYYDSTYFLADDLQFMEDEIEQLRKQELLKLSVNNYTKQMDAIRVDMQDQMVLMGSIVLIILVFCFVALTANIFRFIKVHKREFAIHQMCGARRKSICVRILIPVWSMYFIMCAIVLPAGGNTKAVWISILGLACYIVGISFIPYIYLRKDTIRGMLQNTLG